MKPAIGVLAIWALAALVPAQAAGGPGGVGGDGVPPKAAGPDPAPSPTPSPTPSPAATAAAGTTAAPAAAPTGGPPDAQATPQATAKTKGVELYGAYLMRHSLHEDGSAAARFTPPLPLDNRLLGGAMQSLARIAYGQQGIEPKEIDAFEPRIGRVIKLHDLDYEYEFVLDGTPSKGISLILVRRSELARPTEDAELLKELEKL